MPVTLAQIVEPGVNLAESRGIEILVRVSIRRTFQTGGEVAAKDRVVQGHGPINDRLSKLVERIREHGAVDHDGASTVGELHRRRDNSTADDPVLARRFRDHGSIRPLSMNRVKSSMRT